MRRAKGNTTAIAVLALVFTLSTYMMYVITVYDFNTAKAEFPNYVVGDRIEYPLLKIGKTSFEKVNWADFHAKTLWTNNASEFINAVSGRNITEVYYNIFDNGIIVKANNTYYTLMLPAYIKGVEFNNYSINNGTLYLVRDAGWVPSGYSTLPIVGIIVGLIFAVGIAMGGKEE